MHDCCDSINFFLFQAEDGIRDIGVTGVQTCALPISFDPGMQVRLPIDDKFSFIGYVDGLNVQTKQFLEIKTGSVWSKRRLDRESVVLGKSVDLGGRRIIKKKNKNIITIHTTLTPPHD